MGLLLPEKINTEKIKSLGAWMQYREGACDGYADFT
jgi:hypothetical protein